MSLAQLTKIEGTVLHITTAFANDRNAMRRKCQAQNKLLKSLPRDIAAMFHPTLGESLAEAMRM